MQPFLSCQICQSKQSILFVNPRPLEGHYKYVPGGGIIKWRQCVRPPLTCLRCKEDQERLFPSVAHAA